VESHFLARKRGIALFSFSTWRMNLSGNSGICYFLTYEVTGFSARTLNNTLFNILEAQLGSRVFSNVHLKDFFNLRNPPFFCESSRTPKLTEIIIKTVDLNIFVHNRSFLLNGQLLYPRQNKSLQKFLRIWKLYFMWVN